MFRRWSPTRRWLGRGKECGGPRLSYYEGKWDSMPDFSRLAAVKQGHAATPELSDIPGRPDNYSIQFVDM